MLIPGVHGEIHITRMAHGFPRIQAHSQRDQCYGLGYAHGMDRQMHMWLLKLIGRGQASEKLMGSDDLIVVDRYMRWIGVAAEAEVEVAQLSPQSQAILDAYCQGVNTAVQASKTPWEFRMVGYKPDAWTPADVLLLAKLIGFVGLTQSQGEMEKFIIELLRKGVDVPRVKELFPTITEEIDDEYINLLRQVKLDSPMIPDSVQWHHLLPSFHASNN
ncbi:MAG: penicillin acylase family protein, partial [Ardenticatenaceae bacterium]|nr:penicillin acylase family protein [Ardenticatenaceae bacterium]